MSGWRCWVTPQNLNSQKGYVVFDDDRARRQRLTELAGQFPTLATPSRALKTSVQQNPWAAKRARG